MLQMYNLDMVNDHASHEWSGGLNTPEAHKTSRRRTYTGHTLARYERLNSKITSCLVNSSIETQVHQRLLPGMLHACDERYTEARQQIVRDSGHGHLTNSGVS